MQIKALTAFVNGITGKSYQMGQTYDATDSEGAEYVRAKLAEDVTPRPATVEQPVPPAPKKPAPKSEAK